MGAAVALVGLVLGLSARPAHAADPKLSMTVSQRWQLTTTQGAWTPYVVTVKDEGAGGFSGEVVLTPNSIRTIAPNSFPTYRAPITLARGGQRSVAFYVIDGPDGYGAELRDTAGKPVLRADLGPSVGARSAFGILSDLAQAEQKISTPLRQVSQLDASFVRFGSAREFPTNAAYLSGLSGLIVDQFDSSALSQAQLQTLKDFVGLGGTLIEAGGASWRRTLLSLPQELLPMQPSSTQTA